MISVRSVNNLVGCDVTINPQDEHLKMGTVLEIGPHGVLFKITETHDSSIQVGDVLFISWGNGLSMCKSK